MNTIFFFQSCVQYCVLYFICAEHQVFFKCISVDFQVQGGDWAVNVPAAVTTQLKT